MIDIEKTHVFDAWLKGLKDRRAKARIQIRITRLRLGHYGDVKSVGDGVGELRIFEGKGYRVYFKRQGDIQVTLLCGGDKASQTADIKVARRMARRLEEDHET